jgi:hypothetical protein
VEFFLGVFTAEWEQRRAALLHDLSLGRRKPEDEEERRRRGSSATTADSVGAKTASRLWATGSWRAATGRARSFAKRPMRARFEGLAAGGQPAVVKMASFGGGVRLGAMVNYVSRNGEVPVENERGDQLRGRDQLSAVGGEWIHLMKNRAESRDIGVFKVSVTQGRCDGEAVLEQARKIVRQGLGDRAFALAVTERSDGSGFDIDGITVLRSARGERLSADGKATAIVQRRLDDARSGAAGSASFRFTGYGNGTDYGSARLRSLVEAHKGKVCDEQGCAIGDGKRAGHLVQLEWRGQLHSRKPRDVMHLVLSARAGTDAMAFQDAARDFLGTQFAGHRYVFSLHDAATDPKAEATGGKRPHVHVHVIIAMRSDAGDRIETTISAFRQWRLTMAEKARAHGINMEMTDRRDRASPPAYAQNQVRPMNMIGRTQHAGTSASAQRRYDTKRSDQESFPRTPRSQAYARMAQQEWHSVITSELFPTQKDFAEAQVIRFGARPGRGEGKTVRHDQPSSSGSQFRTYLVKLAELVSENDDMRHMTRPEFEAYEKRVEIALFQAERALPPHEQGAFEDIAKAAREHVNVRRELVDMLEERGRDAGDAPGRSLTVNALEDEKLRWNNAVERHGYATAETANRHLVGIEQSREAISRAEADNQDPDKIRAMKQELENQLIKTAELGAGGNALIREVAEIDEDLKTALQAVERHKAGRERSPSGSEANEGAGSPDRSVPDAALTRVQDDQNRDADGQKTDEMRGSGGDTARGDPARQHVPRLEELQREADEQRARDRDDRD